MYLIITHRLKYINISNILSDRCLYVSLDLYFIINLYCFVLVHSFVNDLFVFHMSTTSKDFFALLITDIYIWKFIWSRIDCEKIFHARLSDKSINLSKNSEKYHKLLDTQRWDDIQSFESKIIIHCHCSCSSHSIHYKIIEKSCFFLDQ